MVTIILLVGERVVFVLLVVREDVELHLGRDRCTVFFCSSGLSGAGLGKVGLPYMYLHLLDHDGDGLSVGALCYEVINVVVLINACFGKQVGMGVAIDVLCSDEPILDGRVPVLQFGLLA